MTKQLLEYSTSGIEIQRHAKGAVVFGASGLIGNCLLRRLLVHQAYDKVISIGRGPIRASHPKLIHYEVDMSQSDNYRHLMRGNDLFIALGTTMKKAGSKEAFYAVDHDLIFNIAKTGSLQNMSQLIVVSSIGADSRSLIYYLKVKGELEDDVKRLPFWGVHIMRPSVLAGSAEKRSAWLKIWQVGLAKACSISLEVSLVTSLRSRRMMWPRRWCRLLKD
jgi:uncharacterized protein YbjT (DUF2867 family)